METFECDPQRLAKLDRRFGGAQGAPDNQVPPQQHQVETSESDNSQNEAIQVDSTSQEIKGKDSKNWVDKATIKYSLKECSILTVTTQNFVT